MKRTLILAFAAIASTLLACAGSDAPTQQNGTSNYQKQMTQAEAQKLIDDLAQAGPVCRRSMGDCSYTAPDANGMVVFEALINCDTQGGCPLLKAETCN